MIPANLQNVHTTSRTIRLVFWCEAKYSDNVKVAQVAVLKSLQFIKNSKTLELLGHSLEKVSKDVTSLSKEVEGLRTDYNRMHLEVEEPSDNEGNDEDDGNDGRA
ncbi:hypothetical protein B7463_g5288, partial [Scytalidium lignicola]